MHRMAKAHDDNTRLACDLSLLSAWVRGKQGFSEDSDQKIWDLITHIDHWVRSLTLSNALAVSNDPPPSYAAATATSVDLAVPSSADAPAVPTASVLADAPDQTNQGPSVAKDHPPISGYQTLSHKFLRFSSTTPAIWWGLKSATTFLLELLRSDGIWSNEKKFRVTEVALAIVWVRLVPVLLCY